MALLAIELQQILIATNKNDSDVVSNEIRNLSKTHSEDAYVSAFWQFLPILQTKEQALKLPKWSLA